MQHYAILILIKVKGNYLVKKNHFCSNFIVLVCFCRYKNISRLIKYSLIYLVLSTLPNLHNTQNNQQND